MSKRMTAKSIIDELKRVADPGLPLGQWDNGFNMGVRVEAQGKRQPNQHGNEGYFWDGKFLNAADDHSLGYNAGVDAVANYLLGKDMTTTPEKTEDQRKFELRLRCFTMAQQGAPRRMNGAEPEPPAETIKRAMFLENYFTTGKLLQPEQLAAVIGKVK